jgi:hypothetical protein
MWNSTTSSETKKLQRLHRNLYRYVTIVSLVMTMIITMIFLMFCSFTRCAAEESNLLCYHSVTFIVVSSTSHLIRVLMVFEFFLVISETVPVFGGTQ